MLITYISSVTEMDAPMFCWCKDNVWVEGQNNVVSLREILTSNLIIYISVDSEKSGISVDNLKDTSEFQGDSNSAFRCLAGYVHLAPEHVFTIKQPRRTEWNYASLVFQGHNFIFQEMEHDLK